MDLLADIGRLLNAWLDACVHGPPREHSRPTNVYLPRRLLLEQPHPIAVYKPYSTTPRESCSLRSAERREDPSSRRAFEMLILRHGVIKARSSNERKTFDFDSP